MTTKPAAPAYWLFAQGYTCPDCGEAFTLKPGAEVFRPDTNTATLDCPVCRARLVVMKTFAGAPVARLAD